MASGQMPLRQELIWPSPRLYSLLSSELAKRSARAYTSLVPKEDADSKAKFLLIHQGFKLANAILKYGAWIYVAKCAVEVVRALAGKSTIVNAVVAAFVSRDNDFAMPWVVAVVCMAWALLE